MGTRARSERTPAGPENTPKCSETTSPAKISSFRCHAKHRFLHPKISNFLCHGKPCVATYNFVVSQRPAFILSENNLQTYLICLSTKLFQYSIMGRSNSKVNSETPRNPALQIVDQLTLLMQLRYGATTLRVM